VRTAAEAARRDALAKAEARFEAIESQRETTLSELRKRLAASEASQDRNARARLAQERAERIAAARARALSVQKGRAPSTHDRIDHDEVSLARTQLAAAQHRAAEIEAEAQDLRRKLAKAEEAQGAAQNALKERDQARRAVAETESRYAEEREVLQRTARDRTAERDAAYDRLREARDENKALIADFGALVSQQRPAPSADLQHELAMARNEVTQMKSSTSWKVSWPIRVLGRALGRGRTSA
jgi:chromosome segregation ATPase